MSSSSIPSNYLFVVDIIQKMTNTKMRFLSLLDVLSFKAARLVVALEEYLPSHLKPRHKSTDFKERNEFVLALIQNQLNESYTYEQILHCRNIINASDESRMEMCGNVDLDSLLKRFKDASPSNTYIRDFSARCLLPYRTICNNVNGGTECGERLRVDFHMTAFIIYPTDIQSCSLYNADCKRCSRSYRISSVYVANQREFLITPEALADNPYFHLSFGKFVYSRELLISFSADLVNGHISFNGAGNALVSKIARLHPGIEKKIDPIGLSRSLEAHWTYYELFNFVFMTSFEKEILVPRGLFSGKMKCSLMT
jgi:hypothetical protein